MLSNFQNDTTVVSSMKLSLTWLWIFYKEHSYVINDKLINDKLWRILMIVTREIMYNVQYQVVISTTMSMDYEKWLYKMSSTNEFYEWIIQMNFLRMLHIKPYGTLHIIEYIWIFVCILLSLTKSSGALWHVDESYKWWSNCKLIDILFIMFYYVQEWSNYIYLLLFIHLNYDIVYWTFIIVLYRLLIIRMCI